ncbi:MAG: low molecular weight phosphotyrosine protein phosphatase [Saprospiraceae bacterium]|nr:low molecular weight phosphotyrosine protein phosphatase [Saprospiraceae bacterium]
MKFLMVCLGNICRSPLAEGILKTKVKEAGLDWEVDSAGTSSYHVGDLPDRRSIGVAQSHGLDITYQRSRQFTLQDLDYFDVVYVMDTQNYEDVFRVCQNSDQEAKVCLIMDMAPEGMNVSVPDPYWGNDGFEQVYKMLENACNGIIKKYK